MEQIHCTIPYHKTHGSRHRINNKSIQEEYKIWVVVAKAYGYVFQFRPNNIVQKKGKQVASSTKWQYYQSMDYARAIQSQPEPLKITQRVVCFAAL